MFKVSSINRNWLKAWEDKNHRKFDFSKEEDQEAFKEAVDSICRHIVHNSPSASLCSLADSGGLTTLYIKVTQKTD